MDWNTGSNLVIAIATVAGVWLVLRSNKKQQKLDQEAKHNELMTAMLAKAEKEYKKEAENDKKFRDLAQEHKDCRAERTRETDDRFNQIEEGQKMAEQKADNMEKTLLAKIEALRKEWSLKMEGMNKEFNLKIENLTNSMKGIHETNTEILKILNNSYTAEQQPKKTVTKKRTLKNENGNS